MSQFVFFCSRKKDEAFPRFQQLLYTGAEELPIMEKLRGISCSTQNA